ncbi:hypothetical protein NQD34_017451 [Periophthalmus magnuspinnatus]|nr:hypothetical protein NQD34_017451 [Periophthalmus magnuspinnatus]
MSQLFSSRVTLQAPHGRLFVRVVDLEDKSLHKDLPQCHIDRSSAAASAELHLLAARVLRNGAEPQISHEPINETLQDQTSEPEINIEQFVPRSPVAWDVDGEDSAVESCEFESNVVRAVKSEPLVTPQSTVWFSSQMSHLDSQLTALQRIADSLETDLSKSRVVTVFKRD